MTEEPPRATSEKSESIDSISASAEPSRIGARIGRYVILGHLGRGGMGDVYSGRDTELGRVVALKFLAPEVLGLPSSVQRFVQEAKSASGINHPNIVTIHEVMQFDSTLAIVMELVDGTPLRKLCGAPLPIDQVVSWAEQIAQALAAAHLVGIVHRDVKPENIMVRRDGYIKLLDFGLARQLGSDGSSSGSGLPNGTWRYMSPEQACGDTPSAQSDVFSLGLVLYEICTGSHPFAADSPFETLHAIGARVAERPSLLNPFVPEKLERLVLAMLAKDPDGRPSAADVARELRQFHWRDMPDVASGPPAPVPAGATIPVRARFWGKTFAAGLAATVLTVSAAAFLIVRSNTGRTPVDAGPAITSIAVLPLSNLTTDSSQDYLVDGMTDQLVTKLAQTTSLRVISSSSVMRNKGLVRPVSQIARSLRVDAILEGSVSRVGGEVRITAKLTDARTDRRLWAHSYEHDGQDILAIEDEVARDISREVAARLSSSGQTHATTGRTPDPRAFDDYLKGRYYWNKRTPAALKSAAAFFEKAVSRDEKYAAAYAGLADTYSMMGEFETLAPEEAHRRAKLAALKALQLDENLAEAHSSLAYAKAAYDRDWAGAEQEFKRAIELSPSYGTAHHWYSACLSILGRHAEALTEIRRAQELDPLSAAVSTDMGWSLYVARRYDAAIAQLKSAVRLGPSSHYAHYRLGFALAEAGQRVEALNEFRQGVSLSRGGAQYLAGLAFGCSIGGRNAEARQILTALLGMRKHHEHVLPSGIAIVYAGLGDKEQVLTWLEKAYEERDDNVNSLNVDPIFDLVRSTPRCRSLLGRLGFSP